MGPTSPLHHLSNPLVTPEQLAQSASTLDGLPTALIDLIRYHGCILTQSAGILLHMRQETIAQAIVTFTRFYTGPEGGSFRVFAAKDVSAASIYLTAKLSPTPASPRSIANVYHYLLSSYSPLLPDHDPIPIAPSPTAYTLTESAYLAFRTHLFTTETLLLRALSFTTTTILPHPLAITILQTLSALTTPPTSASTALAKRALEHCNAALLSPQLLYLTQQPNTLAVAACYLAARETGVRLVGEDAGEWWRVWDVGREELGFVVVAMRSLEGWVKEETGGGRIWRCVESLEGVEEEVSRLIEENKNSGHKSD